MTSLGDKRAEAFVKDRLNNPVIFEHNGLRIYQAYAEHRYGWLLVDPHNWA